MKRAPIAALFALCLSAQPVLAQAPIVEKVDPPDWWARSTVNPVRLLVRGRHLAGAALTCAPLVCARVRVNAAGTYVFADVTIPRGLAPGRYPLALRTRAGRAAVPFSVRAPLPRAGRLQGFGPSDVVYLIMPDRFANGDTANDDPAESRGLHDRANPRYYHGGDLAGIRQRLPYLKDLGIAAIWFTPVYDNYDRPNEKQAVAGRAIADYHGYGPVDHYALEEHFGDLAELRRLVDDAHARDLKIILDMVANHTGPDHPWVNDLPTPTWFNGTPRQHLANNWQIWTLADPHATPALRTPTLGGWFADVLPDLNQDDPEVAHYIIQNSLWWMGVSGADGIRQDTWPYVPRSFWRDWMAALRREYPGIKVVGEVFDGDPTLTSFFQGGRVGFDGIDDGVDAVFDFPLLYPIRRAFGEGGSLREVVQMLARDRLYPRPDLLVTFLGNHDVARFTNERGATRQGLELAFTFLLTARGTPLIYYGDEIAMPGGHDPDNRHDFPGGWPGDPRNAFTAAGRTDGQQEVWSHVQKLLRLRAQRPDLRTAPTTDLVATEQQYVYRRGNTVIALNNDARPAEVKLPLASLPADALGLCPAPKKEGDVVVVMIPARTGCVF